MTVGPLFAVFRFLTGRTATVGPGDVLLLLGLGLHFALLFGLVTTTAERDAILQDILKVIHRLSDGRGVRL